MRAKSREGRAIPSRPASASEQVVSQTRRKPASRSARSDGTRDGDARRTPSVRMVLNRGVSRGGFVFYTNYNSRKAVELVENPRAAIVFHWPKLERQLRVEGRVHKLTRRESEQYFQTRPRESRLSAWASPQSAKIPARSFLEEEFARVQARFGDRRIPCPPFWGGFRLVANCIEFWQGQTASSARSRGLSTKGKNLDESPACAVEKRCNVP